MRQGSSGGKHSCPVPWRGLGPKDQSVREEIKCVCVCVCVCVPASVSISSNVKQIVAAGRSVQKFSSSLLGSG